ncbi:MAG: hypothetical protein DMF70_16320 [Acidobacteria bacterium]|nr:MAG: hypothetical protein DMF70_16320 [Acidobacteriota bacterium]
MVPNAPGPSMTPAATPGSGSAAPAVSLGSRTPQNVNPLTLEEALRLANAQASSFQQAALNEQIAAEDVKQAQAAFLPKVSAPLSYIYTSPAIGLKPGEPRVQSFIANNGARRHRRGEASIGPGRPRGLLRIGIGDRAAHRGRSESSCGRRV